MRYPTPHCPFLMFYWGVLFCHTMALAMLACTGAIITAAPNPSTNTSSRGLRQRCLRLVRVDSSRDGGSNSIVFSIVRLCLFYFSAALLLHPFCPACVNRQQGPLPSCFPSPPLPLWWCHRCIALALPVLARCHHPLAHASSMLLLYLHRCHSHHHCNTLISLPLLPTCLPCIGCILSCHPHQCWCQHPNNKP